MPERLRIAAPVRSCLFVLALAAILVAVPGTALAYIDPGTGSFVIQGIIAAVIGAGVAVRMFWSRIMGALTGRRTAVDEDDDA